MTDVTATDPTALPSTSDFIVVPSETDATEMAPAVTDSEQQPAISMDTQNCWGDTPLHWAVKKALSTMYRKEGVDELESLLQRPPSTRLVHGFPVSELACAQRLHNADGMMPIHIAAAQGNAMVCEMLLKAKAPINARSLRRDPLVLASQFCRPPRWGKRNEHGEIAEVAVADETALHFAVGLLRDQHEMGGSVQFETDLVRLLLAYGADVNAVNFHGQTPFQMAIIGGMHDVVSLLAERGQADLTLSCRSFGQKNTALHLAALLKDVRMVKLLAKCGAVVDAIGRDGWTPLCLAARQGSADVAKALIEAKADVFTPSGLSGKTPLELALLNSKFHKGSAAKSAVLELLQNEVVAKVLDIAYAREAAPSAQQSD